MFVSLSFSLPSPLPSHSLKINKIFKERKGKTDPLSYFFFFLTYQKLLHKLILNFFLGLVKTLK